MSDQQPYGQPYGEPQSYGEPQPYGQVQAPPPPPGYGFPPPQQKTNTMSILGLVFAFLIPLLGLIFSAIGLKQTKQRNEGGRGLAVAGLIISIIFMVIGILVAVVVLSAASTAIKNAGGLDAISKSVASESAALNGGNGKADDKGVAQACHVIIPAASAFDSNAGTTPEEVQAKLGQLSTTLQSAAAGTTDPSFIADVQKLVDDFTALSTSMSQGKDPSSLEGALTADGSKIDQDCAAVGVSG